MFMKNKPLILVDGSSYLYRAFHALPALMNTKNFPTGAIYGMINMLKRLIADYQPEHMAVIFDAKGKTFRDHLYPAYKATRSAMPGELIKQIEPIHRLIQAMGLPLILVSGVEADDVIGTLAIRATQHNIDTVISTGDKDLAQLVNEHVTLINTMTNVILDIEGVQEKFGVPPKQIVEYLTLVGDTSDNIPGVPKVGPKTAVKWLQEYGSLANLITHADQIPGKVGENLRASLNQLPLIQSLVTIKSDVELSLDLPDLKIKPADRKDLIEMFKEMEFKNWLIELLESPEISTDAPIKYTLIQTETAFKECLIKLQQTELMTLDILTTSLDYMLAKLVGLSIALTKDQIVYIPFSHDYLGVPSQLSKEFVLSQLKPLLENPNIKKVGHNIKYIVEVLTNIGIDLQGIAFDTMIESYVLDSTINAQDLSALTLKYLGVRKLSLKEIVGKGNKQLSFNQISIEKAGQYAAENVEMILQLHQTLWPRIQKISGIKHIYTAIETPLVAVLSRMERIGVLIDPVKLENQGKELQKRLSELEQETFMLAGLHFNINSPKQLQEILFQKLNLPILQKTPTGQASTADSVLQELAIDFALPRLIIEYRSLSKLISTYTSRLIAQINPMTNRVHTFYNQAATATGRLSSSEPNLQNIPIRTVEGRKIRQAFVAAKGYKLLSADYSQIELRLMAHISGDPTLLHAFANDLDIHKATAAEVWNVPIEDVTPAMRRDAKAINFGLIYGMSAFGLTRQLGIDRNAAQNYIDRYFTRYPHVKAYMDNTRRQAKEEGYVQTLWGRRLYLPDIHASQIPRQKAAERMAINAPLQGSAADIIKMAMLQIDQWIHKNNIAARMIMQVHDELVFEIAEEFLDEVSIAIRQHMMKVVALQVPLLVSIGSGDNWDEASNH